jgi:hypothetical protein
MTEQWLPVVGHEGSYEVSDLGRVRSVTRRITCADGRTRTYRGRILKPAWVGKWGHVGYHLGREHKARGHVMVLRAFVGLCPPGQEPRHRNGIADDNKWSNLHYGTKSQNALDMVAHGTHNNARKTCCPLEHLLVMPNLVAAKAAIGHRKCLACNRAAKPIWKLRRAGHEIDEAAAKAIADSYYSKIMGIAA